MSLAHQKELEGSYVMHTFGRSEVEFTSGSGMTLTDDQGREYLDFLAGIGVCSLGHAHPAVTSAITGQAQRLFHVSNYFYVEHRGEVAEKISELASRDVPEGEKTVWKTFFANSGAEANECAMKLARLWSHRAGNGGNAIVCLAGGFHGRTLETVAATMQERLQKDFRPLPEGFYAVEPNDIAALEAVFEAHGDEICAVMVEPIQGESGVHPLTDDYMRAIRRITREHVSLMICDEVQCGIFRTGKPFAFQLSGAVPDIFSMAKGIAGGFPMGACAARAGIADAFRPGDHGTTFGGGPVACAAAEAVLTELDEGAYDKRAAEVGAYLQERLAVLPHVVEVRGAGLMVGCDLDEAAGDAHDVVARALAAGLVINATGARTLRFLPPLIATKADVDACIAILEDVLA